MTPPAPASLAFLFDQHVNAPALHELRCRGVDVVHVAEVGLADADDPGVLDWARRQGRIVVTRNCRDFAPIVTALAGRGIAFPGVLFLATSIRQSDAMAHVRALERWIAAARAGDANPVAGSYTWLR
ncbi:MAG TPA: DUF5615 family PIN-like protein [Longimicrobiales bacterium]|nr:DUF5615 family PIN-like protein [Longimicrobiales bacterium]